MLHAVYNALWIAAGPAGRVYLRLSRKNRDLRARLNPQLPPLAGRPVWIHACSVGEVGAARVLAAALKRAYAKVPLLFTVSTRTGHEQAARQLEPLGGLAGCPFDAPGNVRDFVRRAQPRMLILIETEISPNLQRECERADVPVLLVNGRLSEKHFHRYQRARGLFSPRLRGSRSPRCRTKPTPTAFARWARAQTMSASREI